MWFTASLGMGARMPLAMIAAMVQGQSSLTNGTADPAVGAVVHMVLSAAFGMAFALVAARVRSAALISAAGVGYGALLYLVNFVLVAPLLFPWFQDANQPFELVVHIVFGTLLALAMLVHRRRSITG